jgi:sugar O-acyltransferase (sialic acid O-acetyltransferase NeuD family)
MSVLLYAPMVNVNEEQMNLVEWHKQPKEFVNKGELLATFETTKSTYDFHATDSGFFVPLVEAGSQVTVGEVIAALTDQPDEDIQTLLPSETEKLEAKPHSLQQTAGNRWTRKAEILAKRHNVPPQEMESLTSADVRITEEVVQAYLQQKSTTTGKQANQGFSNATELILILGGGNVACLVLDILARIPQQTAVAILDDNPALQNTTVMGVPVLGNLDRAKSLFDQNFFDKAALAVGILPARRELFEKLSNLGIPFANIIDPSAIIGVNASMGIGNMIMAFCRLGPESQIGDNNFLSAYANIEHHNRMGSHCTFGPGVAMSGGVTIGNSVRFGTGIFIEPRLTIGNNAVIASGVTLTADVPENTVVRAKANFHW